MNRRPKTKYETNRIHKNQIKTNKHRIQNYIQPNITPKEPTIKK